MKRMNFECCIQSPLFWTFSIFQGKSGDRVGFFPANFVQRVRPGERVWRVLQGLPGNRERGHMAVKESQVFDDCSPAIVAPVIFKSLLESESDITFIMSVLLSISHFILEPSRRVQDGPRPHRARGNLQYILVRSKDLDHNHFVLKCSFPFFQIQINGSKVKPPITKSNFSMVNNT